jgi:hypothetical protein
MTAAVPVTKKRRRRNAGTFPDRPCYCGMADNEYPRPGDIRGSIQRLRLEAAWYRRRLQETYDRLAVLEHTASTQSSDVSDRPASDDDGNVTDKNATG